MRTLNEIEELLNEKREINTKEIQDFEAKKEQATQAIQRANDNLIAAESDADIESYQKAKDVLWSAKNAIELYDKQIENLMSIPLISKEEYNQLVHEVERSADAIHSEQVERVVELIAEIREISKESNKTTTQANDLLQLLQRKLYREPVGRVHQSDGTTRWSSDKTYRTRESVADYYNTTIKGTLFSQRAGEETEHRRLNIRG